MRTRWWLIAAAPVGLALAVVLLAAAPAADRASQGPVHATRHAARGHGDFDPRGAPPPWRHRCRIAIAAYEDGSASLYCAGRRRRFATIDAESGRIRMRMPWAGHRAKIRAGSERVEPDRSIRRTH